MGAMQDDSKNSLITVPEIREALESVNSKLDRKMDIVGFDACIMAEVAYELKDTADYYMASEENEGGAGWTYDSILNQSNKSAFSGENMMNVLQSVQTRCKSKIAADLTPEVFVYLVCNVLEENRDNSISTFSAIKLFEMQALKEALDDFSYAVIDNPASYSSILNCLQILATVTAAVTWAFTTAVIL